MALSTASAFAGRHGLLVGRDRLAVGRAGLAVGRAGRRAGRVGRALRRAGLLIDFADLRFVLLACAPASPRATGQRVDLAADLADLRPHEPLGRARRRSGRGQREHR